MPNTCIYHFFYLTLHSDLNMKNMFNPKNQKTMARAIDTTTLTTTAMTPALTRLVADIRRYPTLTPEQEVEKLAEYAAAGPARKEAIKGEIITSNLRFALSVAKKYTTDGDFVCELVSIATFGLVKAVETYDLSMGFKFISYAVHKIRAEFSEYFRNDANIVRRTNNAIIGSKDKAVAEKFFQRNYREPSEEEIIEALEAEYGIKVSDKTDILAVRTARLDAKVDSDDDATVSEIGEVAMVTASRNDYEREMELEDAEYRVRGLITCLSFREQEVVMRKFGIGFEREYELEEIASELGYTHERVRQILKGAMERLKNRGKHYRKAENA